MKFSTFLLWLACAGAVSLSAQGIGDASLSEAERVTASVKTVNEGIVPIPDCFPCSEDNDPYSEGPADYPPIPFPKPPGLPKCYPICNLDETVAATEQALIVPIPDCFPCSEDNDPYSEGPADYPPIPFPKPPGLPKCYPICNLEGDSAASLTPLGLVHSLQTPEETAPMLFQVETASVLVPALALRRSRHGLS
jgi:hypothetical protein